MILNDYFMVIPVYRLKKDEYSRQMQQHLDKQFENDSDLVKKAYQNNSNLKAQFESHFRKTYGGAWEFNEIIGFIKLYFYGTQIRGEYWSVAAKRITKTRKKQFEYKTHKLSYELTIRDKSNNSILAIVQKYIENCKKELKNRYLDTREFDTLAPYINWELLYKDKNRI